MTTKELLEQYHELKLALDWDELPEPERTQFVVIKKYLSSRTLFPVLNSYYVDKQKLAKIAENMECEERTISRKKKKEIKKLDEFVHGTWLKNATPHLTLK